MPAGRRKRILVVDDDVGIREMIQDALLDAGYDVELAASSDEAMKLYRRKGFDLAIVDIIMPDRDGLETLMEMRRNSGNAKVLAISGGGHIGSGPVLAMADKLGAKATLPKPFTPEELVARVGDLLQSP